MLCKKQSIMTPLAHITLCKIKIKISFYEISIINEIKNSLNFREISIKKSSSKI